MNDKPDGYRSFVLTAQNVIRHWTLLEPHIDRALEHGVGELTSFDICKLALNDQAQIWATVDHNEKLSCVTVTKIIVTQNTKHLHIVCLTSVDNTVRNMKDQFHNLEDFAKHNGCKSLQVWGRKGWERKLKPLKSRSGNSFKTLYYVFDQEL